ncbi:MAG: permease [Bacteroidales bacterium]
MNISEYIKTFLIDLLTIVSEMAPYLLLGFFFAGMLYAFVPKQSIEKHLNGSPLKSSLLASLFGVPLPLCSCGVTTTGTALFKN